VLPEREILFLGENFFFGLEKISFHTNFLKKDKSLEFIKTTLEKIQLPNIKICK